VNPLVAVSLGWLVLGEAVTWGLAIGGAITLIGVILVIQGERNRPVTLADADLQAVDSR
jgi:drug/metabolite transporter (DMT)-like permease